jgi:hypothetical protein
MLNDVTKDESRDENESVERKDMLLLLRRNDWLRPSLFGTVLANANYLSALGAPNGESLAHPFITPGEAANIGSLTEQRIRRSAAYPASLNWA